MGKTSINQEHIGRMAVSIKTPVIRKGDDLKRIVIDSCLNALGEFKENDVIGITEAVVAIAQGNFATPEDIRKSISEKYPDATEIMLLFPIQSRNRFMNIPKAIAAMPQIKKIYIVLSFPCDEVGNRLISEGTIFETGVNTTTDIFNAEEFYTLFGIPQHMFTGKNYIEEFQKVCEGKAEVIMCNDLAEIAGRTHNVLICSIREEHRKLHKKFMKQYGVKNVYDMSQILNKPINNSGYSPEYGLYGSNMMANGKLKLMPRDSQKFVEELQDMILRECGKHVEVMIYGDGAFKDPVSGIWELADPVTTLGATSGLIGRPKEVKLKYWSDKFPNATQEELMEIIANEKTKLINKDDISAEAAMGTTPRQKTDLLATLEDLMSGSGDECTPVICVRGYLK